MRGILTRKKRVASTGSAMTTSMPKQEKALKMKRLASCCSSANTALRTLETNSASVIQKIVC